MEEHSPSTGGSNNDEQTGETTQQTLGGIAVDDTPDREDHWLPNGPRTLAEAGRDDADIPEDTIEDAVEADEAENGTFGEKTENHDLIRNNEDEEDEDALPTHPIVIQQDFRTAHEVSNVTNQPVELTYEPEHYTRALN